MCSVGGDGEGLSLFSGESATRRIVSVAVPRLTNQSYLQQRTHLRECWIGRRALYGKLTASQQWDLHAFFRPTEDFTDDEAIAHRVHLSKVRPSMPHRAGKAYRAFEEVERAAVPARAGTRSRTSDKVIHVRSVVRPEPDFAKLVRGLMVSLREREKTQRPPDDSAA